jgi:hypothetical protein
MVRILVLKRLYNLSDEQMEYQLLDRMSYKRFCASEQRQQHPGTHHPVWVFENRIGPAGAKALCELCDDDDGGLLQPEAAGLFPKGRNQDLVTPEMGRIAAVLGDSGQKWGPAAEKNGHRSKKSSRVRARALLYGRIGWKYRVLRSTHKSALPIMLMLTIAAP